MRKLLFICSLAALTNVNFAFNLTKVTPKPKKNETIANNTVPVDIPEV